MTVQVFAFVALVQRDGGTMTLVSSPLVFEGLTTPHLADACVRLGVPVRCGPCELRALDPARCRIAGVVRPVRHYGSVDVFLEALEGSREGEVLVVDNGGRRDEACVGDLMALETKAAMLAGMVIWGLHRDTADIREIGLPLFSLGAVPTGPLELRKREPEALVSARVGEWLVTERDAVLADEDGVIFVPLERAAELAASARGIRDQERKQAQRVRAGEPLRAQLRFSEYLSRRSADPTLTFRNHLRRIGGAVEE